MRLTDRGWIVLWIVFLLGMAGLMLLIDTFVLDITITQQEMESLQ